MAAPIVYTTRVDDVAAEDLHGFFVDWPSPPSAERHVEILQGSDHVVLAREPGGRVVGFATSVSDGVLAAHIPFLEVLPEWQGRGIGSELVRRLLEVLHGLYMVDVVCDEDLEPFYERFGMMPLRAMVLRDRNALRR